MNVPVSTAPPDETRRVESTDTEILCVATILRTVEKTPGNDTDRQPAITRTV